MSAIHGLCLKCSVAIEQVRQADEADDIVALERHLVEAATQMLNLARELRRKR